MGTLLLNAAGGRTPQRFGWSARSGKSRLSSATERSNEGDAGDHALSGHNPRLLVGGRPWRELRGALIALSSVGSIALLGCGRSDAKANANAPHVVRVVEIDQMRPATYETMHYTGVVRARTESQLGFRVAGK